MEDLTKFTQAILPQIEMLDELCRTAEAADKVNQALDATKAIDHLRMAMLCGSEALNRKD